MGTKELQSRKQAVADAIGGRVVEDDVRVAVSIKGIVEGFPATLEAIYPTWPFGVMYTVETSNNANEAPSVEAGDKADRPSGRITIYPRIGRGLMSVVTKVIMFENGGMPVGDKRLEDAFNFNYDVQSIAERFAQYPGVADHLHHLDEHTKFTEIVIRTNIGIYLSRPNSFNSLEPDDCAATFKAMSAIGQVLFEAF